MSAVAATTCSAQQEAVISMLLSAGAQTTCVDKNGFTPFFAATACRNLRAMQLIRASGGVCSLRSQDGDLAYETWEEEDEEITDWLQREGIAP